MTTIEKITKIIDELGTKAQMGAIINKWKFPNWPDVFVLTLVDTPSVGITSFFARRPDADLTLVSGSRYGIDISLDLAVIYNVLADKGNIKAGRCLENAFHETLPKLPHGTLMKPWPWPELIAAQELRNVFFCVPITQGEYADLKTGLEFLEARLIKTRRDVFDFRDISS